MVMTAMFGLGLALSKVKSIFSPFLLYAVIGGMPTDGEQTINVLWIPLVIVMKQRKIYCQFLYLGVEGHKEQQTNLQLQYH